MTAIVMGAYLPRLGDRIPSPHRLFDPPLQAFLIGWDWHALTTAPGTLFNPPIFHPETRTLTYMDSMIGETLLAAPVLAARGSIAAAYNFVLLASFALSAWGAYRLTRLFSVSRPGAFLAGLFFGFCPYRFANLDLLNQLQTQFLPWGIFFAVRLARRGRPRDAAGTLAMVAAQVYFGWYYAYYLAIATAITLFVARIGRVGTAHPIRWRALALATLIALIAVAPVVVPYVLQRTAEHGLHRTLGESALYSADLLDYVRTNPGSLAARLPWAVTGSHSYWPGLIAVAFCLMGILAAWRGRDRLAAIPVALAGSGFVLSLGPILHLAGRAIPIPLPYALLYYVVPGVSGMRAPARFAVLVALGVAVLAGIGYERSLPLLRVRSHRRILTLALVLLVVVGDVYRPAPGLPLPNQDTIAPIYRRLAATPGTDPVLEIPVPATEADENVTHALRQYALLGHGRPRLDGVSGFVTPRYREFRRIVQSFPARDALTAAKSFGARWVIVHYGDYAPERRADLGRRVAAEPGLESIAREGSDVLYRLSL
ncbi:MAG TPA: hypothetical protein VL503_04145 [Candidatus Omnitrophota bacterium]|nr:hypothetical protein [Candidatus Omnitrophota bacterium]